MTDPSDPIEAISDARVLPVVTIDDADLAVPLARALAAGGLSVVEVTLRTDAGLAAIAAIADGSPSSCVGAGSVTTATQAKEAIEAGARFLVSPGFDEGVVAAAQAQGVPLVPGIATATELMRAVARGFGLVKLFPAEAIGGVATLNALSSVWPRVSFLPTGGISGDNAAAYLAEPHVAAVGGSWMASPYAIASQDWASITALAAAARELASSSW